MSEAIHPQSSPPSRPILGHDLPNKSSKRSILGHMGPSLLMTSGQPSLRHMPVGVLHTTSAPTLMETD